MSNTNSTLQCAHAALMRACINTVVISSTEQEICYLQNTLGGVLILLTVQPNGKVVVCVQKIELAHLPYTTQHISVLTAYAAELQAIIDSAPTQPAVYSTQHNPDSTVDASTAPVEQTVPIQVRRPK